MTRLIDHNDQQAGGQAECDASGAADSNPCAVPSHRGRNYTVSGQIRGADGGGASRLRWIDQTAQVLPRRRLFGAAFPFWGWVT